MMLHTGQGVVYSDGPVLEASRAMQLAVAGVKHGVCAAHGAMVVPWAATLTHATRGAALQHALATLPAEAHQAWVCNKQAKATLNTAVSMPKAIRGLSTSWTPLFDSIGRDLKGSETKAENVNYGPRATV